MIKTIGINKIFRTDEVETHALNNVSLEIKQGEFVAVMGPSGCGKSTLLNILGTLDNPSSGNYFFEGEEVSNYSEKQRAHLRKGKIGYIFQNFNLIDELNVFENVELPLLYLNITSSERKNRVKSVLEQVKMAHRVNHYPVQLSGGQQQRVAVARAIIGRPQIILADEPTGNLDSRHGEEIMNILKDLNETGTTLVMVTHSNRDAEYANKLIKLFDGQLITQN